MPRVDQPSLVALVPIKGVNNKSRLASVLSVPQRRRLSRWMLERTLSALAGVRAVEHIRLIGNAADEASRHLACALNVTFVCETAPDLNRALQVEFDHCLAQAQSALIMFSDLPLATPAALEEMVAAANASQTILTLAPDTQRRGTNALLYRGSAPLAMVYGPNSFSCYLEQARRRNISHNEFFDKRLAWDLDTPEDWAQLAPRLHALGAPVEVAPAA